MRFFVTALFIILSGTMVATVQAQPAQSLDDTYRAYAAPKPLYRDPVYDGAADPVVVFNKKEQKWFMYYTNRRATIEDRNGVVWVHGTRIGIAESTNGGATWTYRDTCNINYRPNAEYTHWAPEVIEVDGTWHMYLTYVPGIFTDWSHPRDIVHLTSTNGIDWEYRSTLQLQNNKVIDACVFRLDDGTWRLWYNNELDGKSVYYADSKDLYQWTNKGKANLTTRGEGPKVFHWQGYYWMVVDAWRGLLVYRSSDALNWEQQEDLLVAEPGTGPDDGAIGQHPDVVVNKDKAYLFYFTHPGRKEGSPSGQTEQRRSSIQVVELKFGDGTLFCDRNETTFIALRP